MEKGFLYSAFASCQDFLTMKQNYRQISKEVIVGTYSGNLESINLQSQHGNLLMTQSYAMITLLIMQQHLNDN